MQNAVPKGEGGMVAVLGSTVEIVEKILKENKINLKLKLLMIILKVKLF